MYLKRLEISGFKSFAKRSVLDFTSPISGIVGPNGSGKSNVAESFRFVLGEQSLKSMRGKKGEDLIWNGGSGTISRSNRASVKIIFDNTKKIFNLDFDEVAIERVVYRDSLSEYLINNSPVRLKDISELLAHAHIGSSGHHIISQGEADHILIASSRERREMIEDALGLRIYQYKKRESERKLEKTEENIKSAESLRREIAPHLRFLSKQVEKIEKAKVMRDELVEIYKQYLRREQLFVNHLKKESEDQIRGPENRLKQIELELCETRKIVENNPEIAFKQQEVLKVENELRGVRNQKDNLFHQIGRLEGEISALEKVVAKNKILVISDEEIRVSLNEVKIVREEVEKELGLLGDSADSNVIKNVLFNIKNIFQNFFNKFSGGKQDVDNQAGFSNEMNKLKQDKDVLESEIKQISDTENQLYSRYDELRQKMEEAKDKNREAERDIFRLMSEQKDAYNDLNSARDRLNEAKNVEENLKREIEEGGMLLGRSILYFNEDENIKDEQGNLLTVEIVLSENRSDQSDRLKTINKLKVRVEDAGISGGEEVLKEYNETKERDEFLDKELIDLKTTSASLIGLIKDLDQKIENEFRGGIEKINKQFQEFFAMMFDGGKALIKLVEQEKRRRKINLADLEGDDVPEEVLDEDEKPEIGIDIDIRLPRKNIRGLEMLSGGERALTSIALLFAISQVNPPPFIILDETDAALDESNSRRYGDMIENLAKLSQLILITHNRETMARAGVLYGITMGSDGISALLSVGFEEAVAVAK